MVDTTCSGLSLQSWDSRLVLPEPVRPMQTRSYSGRAGGGPLQHSARKHCGGSGSSLGERGQGPTPASGSKEPCDDLLLARRGDSGAETQRTAHEHTPDSTPGATQTRHLLPPEQLVSRGAQHHPWAPPGPHPAPAREDIWPGDAGPRLASDPQRLQVQQRLRLFC